MDRVDQRAENTFKIETGNDLVTEKLDITPQHLAGYTDGKVVLFGNTGLVINFNIERCNFNFLPEDNMGSFYRLTKKSPKYAFMLSASLFSLYQFLNNKDEMVGLGINDSDVGEMSTYTNDRLANAFDELFLKSDNQGVVLPHHEGQIRIDLRIFKDLEENDPLIKYLKNVSDRAKDITVTYWKRVSK